MSLARAKQRVFGTGVTCNEISVQPFHNLFLLLYFLNTVYNSGLLFASVEMFCAENIRLCSYVKLWANVIINARLIRGNEHKMHKKYDL